MSASETAIFFFEHIVDFPYVLQLVCVAFSAVLLLGKTYKGAWRFAVPLIETVVLSVVFLGLNLSISILTNYLEFLSGFSNALMFLIGMTLYAVIRSDQKPLCRLAMTSVVYATALSIADMGTLVGNAISSAVSSVNDDFGIDVVAAMKIISYLLILFCAVLYKFHPLYRYDTTVYDVGLNVGTNFLAAFAVIFFDVLQVRTRGVFKDSPTARITFSTYAMIIVLVMFCMCILTYFMTYNLCREKKRALAYQIERQKSKALQELVRLSETKITELREIKHDLKNQYAYMSNMLAEKKYDELEAYFAEHTGTFAKPLFQSMDSGNKMIDSILNLELTKATEKGILLSCKIVVPHSLDFEETDMLSLVTNIIDNALEACVREETENATVSVTMGVQGDYFCICVSNPTTKEEGEVPEDIETSKANKAEHGYGRKIIRKIVKKYNGYYRCYVSEAVFYSECMLDMGGAV